MDKIGDPWSLEPSSCDFAVSPQPLAQGFEGIRRRQGRGLVLVKENDLGPGELFNLMSGKQCHKHPHGLMAKKQPRNLCKIGDGLLLDLRILLENDQ